MTSSFKIFGEILKVRTAVMEIVPKPLVRFVLTTSAVHDVLTAEVCMFLLRSSATPPTHSLSGSLFCLQTHL